MHIKKSLAVAAAGCALVAGATLPATAGASHSHAASTKTFHSTLKPHKNVHVGTTMHLKGRGAEPNTTYICLFAILHKSNYAAYAASEAFVTSNSSGRVSCTKTFAKYSATDQHGKTRHCPLTKKDAKAHFRCAMVMSTGNKSSATVGYFTAHGSKKA